MIQMMPKTKKYNNAYSLRDIYPYYIANLINKKGMYNIDKRTFTNICKDFNKELSSKIIKEGYTFKMPFNLGSIGIRSFKMKIAKDKLKVDFKKTKELGFTVYHLNEHTNNIASKWYWDKKLMKNPGKHTYSFIATRDNKRNLAAQLLNPDNDIRYISE